MKKFSLYFAHRRQKWRSAMEWSDDSQSGDAPAAAAVQDDSAPAPSRRRPRDEAPQRGRQFELPNAQRRNPERKAVQAADEAFLAYMAHVPLTQVVSSGIGARAPYHVLLQDLIRHVRNWISEHPAPFPDPKRARFSAAEFNVLRELASPALSASEVEASCLAFPKCSPWSTEDWKNFLQIESRQQGLYYSPEFEAVLRLCEDRRRVAPLSRARYLNLEQSIVWWINDVRRTQVGVAAESPFAAASHMISTRPAEFRTVVKTVGDHENAGDILPSAGLRRGLYAWKDAAGGIDLSPIAELPFRKSFRQTLPAEFNTEAKLSALTSHVARHLQRMCRDTNYFAWEEPQDSNGATYFASFEAIEGSADEFRAFVDDFLDDILSGRRRPPVGNAAELMVPRPGENILEAAARANAAYRRQPHELVPDFLLRVQGYTPRDARLFWYWCGQAALENAFEDPDDPDIDWTAVALRQAFRPMVAFTGTTGTGKSTLLACAQAIAVQPPTLLKTDAADIFVLSALKKPASMIFVQDAGKQKTNTVDALVDGMLDYVCNDPFKTREMNTSTTDQSNTCPARTLYQSPRASIGIATNSWRPTEEQQIRRFIIFGLPTSTQKEDTMLKSNAISEAFKMAFVAAFWYVVYRLRFEGCDNPSKYWSPEGRARLEKWTVASSYLQRFIDLALEKAQGEEVALDPRFFKRLGVWQRNCGDMAIQRAHFPGDAVSFQQRMRGMVYSQRTTGGQIEICLVGYKWNESVFRKGSDMIETTEPVDHHEPTYDHLPPEPAAQEPRRSTEQTQLPTTATGEPIYSLPFYPGAPN